MTRRHVPASAGCAPLAAAVHRRIAGDALVGQPGSELAQAAAKSRSNPAALGWIALRYVPGVVKAFRSAAQSTLSVILRTARYANDHSKRLSLTRLHESTDRSETQAPNASDEFLNPTRRPAAPARSGDSGRVRPKLAFIVGQATCCSNSPSLSLELAPSSSGTRGFQVREQPLGIELEMHDVLVCPPFRSPAEASFL